MVLQDDLEIQSIHEEKTQGSVGAWMGLKLRHRLEQKKNKNVRTDGDDLTFETLKSDWELKVI